MTKLRTQSQGLVDQVFQPFCRQHGLTNIREYEETRLTATLELHKKLLDYSTQQSQLRASLEYERSRQTLVGGCVCVRLCAYVCVCV